MRSHIVAAFALALAAAGGLAGCSRGTPDVIAGVDGGQGLTIFRPHDVVITRGGSQQIVVRLERRDLPGEVRVRFGNLPSGVQCTDEDVLILGDAGSFTFQASGSAPLVDGHPVTVTATGPNNVTASEQFEMQVKAGGR